MRTQAEGEIFAVRFDFDRHLPPNCRTDAAPTSRYSGLFRYCTRPAFLPQGVALFEKRTDGSTALSFFDALSMSATRWKTRAGQNQGISVKRVLA